MARRRTIQNPLRQMQQPSSFVNHAPAQRNFVTPFQRATLSLSGAGRTRHFAEGLKFQKSWQIAGGYTSGISGLYDGLGLPPGVQCFPELS